MKYHADGSQGAYQPGSCDTVLSNKLGIVDATEMEQAETAALSEHLNAILGEIHDHQELSVQDIKRWHKDWLGDIYEWAGQYRDVNLSKDGFPFAGANYIAKAMVNFEADVLGRFTPCAGMETNDLIHALAVSHAELIIIHPFREGNGRIARLLNTIMGLQAGAPPLDFTLLATEWRGEYIKAIQQSRPGNYGRMEKIFAQILSISQQ